MNLNIDIYYILFSDFQHGSDSNKPIPYSHVDIAGSSGPFPGIPTGAPLVAMAHAYVLNRESGHK